MSKSNNGTMLDVCMSCELRAVECQKEAFTVCSLLQRSKECPICWQLLILKDPASQELLNAVEAEKRLSSRTVYSHAFMDSRSPLQRLNNDQDDSCSDDSDFDEQLMQHLVSAASRARYICRSKRQRSPGAGPSEVLVFNSSIHASGMQPTLTTSPTSGVPSAAHIQSPTSTFSCVGMVTTNTSSESDMPSKPRVIYSQPSPESARRLNTSEMFSFSESFKSKLSAASARCKESISKNTRGLKEKLIARNASVKELSKGVQCEMNAGIACVARMIERLDLTSKWSSSALIPVKGKSVQENGVLVGNVTSNASSLDSSLVAVGVETPPSCVQSGHDAART
ncbi:E3 ubiquitin-protein ligase RHF1A [Glycine soja]|nr:E3 ubiquitin-protein ligase RHF1A [Glycine soja]